MEGDNGNGSGAQSRVSSAAASQLDEEEIEDEMSASATSLNMRWSFGVNRNVPVHNLSNGGRKMALFVCAHVGVMFDWEGNKQQLLQGHCNAISCTCVSEDRRWIATADRGTDSMVILWDSFTTIPVQTIFEAHPDGCAAIAMSPDAKYIATISYNLPQTVSVWDWTNNGETPMCSATLDGDFGKQTYITFNAEDSSQLVSNSETQVVFYSWNESDLEYVAPPLTDKDFNRSVGLYSQSIFQLQSPRALTATSCGNIVVWEHAGGELPCNRKAFKIVKLQEKALTVLTTTDKYIVTGDVAGHVRFLDQQLRLTNWYKHFNAGPISTVSFSYSPKTADVQTPENKTAYPASSTLEGTPHVVNDFVISTSTANVAYFRTDGSTLQCFMWYPPIVKEDFLVVANDQFKLKLYNSTTKMCRQTLLGPTYGTPLRRIITLPSYEDRPTRYLAYITLDKVGLQCLPLDGNPHKTMALIAHPEGVRNLVCSYDGKYVFTAGGEDCSVLMWEINLDALEAAAALGGEGLMPFYGLLEGGRDGELFAELEDYFYYAQIRSQGVDTTDTRQVSTKVPLGQVPYLMRALGFYPTEQEVDDMINEVKFSNYVSTGKYVREIDLGEFIKCKYNFIIKVVISKKLVG
ncbi:PREDICTED: WD repeat-containing protein 66-like [Acropora digitifera]|uniref:WD repeat-containing protein 66-like n=1 Tax=Acropora digitifera TaxID=70779 RepID=UPI00077A7696|nr:PREDICTED: WD repeat-containing protein 66-like [Acropora digitifera]